MRSADLVFKALGDPTRRLLLDRLRERSGQTLGELCEHLSMTRQATTQHLAVLEAADLVVTERRGREKLHHLNAVPLHEIGERWINTFERPRLRALGNLKRRAEDPVSDTFVYVTYIDAPPERVWSALTDPQTTAEYWGHSNVSDWEPGSRWAHVRTDGSGIEDVVGTVLESVPPVRLVTTWAAPDAPAKTSRVTFDLVPHGGTVRLTVTHTDLTDPADLATISHGWPAVLSNLKSYVETGTPLSAVPWDLAPA